MKKAAILFLLFTSFAMNAQDKKEKPKTQIVEASCGQCQFGMKAEGCSLAVRIDGKPYFVDGTSLDQYGDAHAHDGFCNAIRKAEVSGKIVNDRFVVSSFQLIDEKKGTKQ